MKNPKSIVLITKDALCRAYLPCYGNKFWIGKTPNIDELVLKGIKYERFYTAAPSSAMSYLSMFTGKYPYEQEIGTFKPIDTYKGDTLFDKANNLGYSTHVIWDEGWMDGAYKYSSCYGSKTIIHPIKGLSQRVGAQFKHDGDLVPNIETEKKSLKLINDVLSNIFISEKKTFIWIHIPHVINGRTCYGSDIDLFDQIIGIIREFVLDENIYISSDHGNMNGLKGKLAYGFDVYEPACRIPLITPKNNNSVGCNELMVNVDMFDIIFGNQIPKRDYIILDSAYYAQKNRSLGIVSNNYKYIYHKKEKSEELFDIYFDPNENFNLINDFVVDPDRHFLVPSKEEYFYPDWDKLPFYRNKFREIKNLIWKEATLKQKFFNNLKDFIRPIYIKLRKVIKK